MKRLEEGTEKEEFSLRMKTMPRKHKRASMDNNIPETELLSSLFATMVNTPD